MDDKLFTQEEALKIGIEAGIKFIKEQERKA